MLLCAHIHFFVVVAKDCSIVGRGRGLFTLLCWMFGSFHWGGGGAVMNKAVIKSPESVSLWSCVLIALGRVPMSEPPSF